MKYTAAIFCLVVGVTVVNAASISGNASIDKRSVSVGGSIIFPRIPDFNAPLSDLFGSRRPANSSSNNNNSRSTLSRLQNLFDIPDPQSLIPDLSSLGSNLQDVEIPSIPEPLMERSSIPGVSKAMQEARDHVAKALQLGSNFTAGIQEAIQDAFASNDPTDALRTIIRTIIDAYVTIAANCPLIVVGSRVLQEGIRLAIEVARSARNVITGTTSAPNPL